MWMASKAAFGLALDPCNENLSDKLHREWYHFENVIDPIELQIWSSEIKNLVSEVKAEKVYATSTQILDAKRDSLKAQFEARMKALDEIVACQEYMKQSLTESFDGLAPTEKEQVISSLILIKYPLSGARTRRVAWARKKPYLIQYNQVTNQLQENKRWLEHWALRDLEMRHVEACNKRRANLSEGIKDE